MESIHTPPLGDVLPARRHRAGYRLIDQSDRQPVVREGKFRDAPGYPGRGSAQMLDGHWTADDRVVEAMLASVREPCTASQLASGLEWTLTRTIAALNHLEAALADTGQTLIRLGHHHYTLQPRDGLLHKREIGRCLRHTRDPVDLTTAAVLYRALTCSREDRARDALNNPAEHAAAGRLIAARLLEDDHGFLRPTALAEATFRAAPERRYLRWTAQTPTSSHGRSHGAGRLLSSD